MTRGVILMTYGSPDSLDRDDIATYLGRVRGGRQPTPELVDEFTRRYHAIGGSPLIGTTRDQAAVLSDELGWPVEIGMRFSEPSIDRGLRTLAEMGAREVVAIILSPQYSPILMGGYARAIQAAVSSFETAAPEVRVAGAWHEERPFIEAVAARIRRALDPLRWEDRGSTHVLMTAHSLPRRVAEQEPGYLAQLRATADDVATAVGLRDDRWTFCWQSAGHEPGEWMTPDFVDLMPRIAAAGNHRVLVVPVQFLADHLETLYDIDIGAREQAERAGLQFSRITSLGTDRGLASALASVARKTLAQPVSARQ